MTNPLPPLTALRAFEAAARHLSFTRAADELGMTQAAVSYQIKLLEERVGSPLFLRRPRQVALSEAGERLAPAVREAFDMIRTAFAATRSSADGLLVISTMPTFGAQWLAQNLGLFQLAHPGIGVRLDSTARIVDFAREEVDAGIRGGTGNFPGLSAHFLLRTEFSPMLSPKLAESAGGIHEPADLLNLPLIDAADPWFKLWFEAAGVSTDHPAFRPTNVFGTQSLAASAAMAGRGVAMLTPAFYRSEIADGRLLQPFAQVGTDKNNYWLVYPESSRNFPKIRAFRDWLLDATAPLRDEEGGIASTSKE